MEEIQDKAAKIADKLNDAAISPIFERIRDVKRGEYSSEMYQKDVAEILKHSREVDKESRKLIRELYADLAFQNYLFAETFLKFRGIDYSFTADKFINGIIDSVAEQTAGTFANLSNTTVIFMNNKPLNYNQAYTTAIDKAVYEMLSGTTDYYTAMRRTVDDLSQGLCIVNYESGYKRRLDTAVRQNVLDGAKQINNKLQKYYSQIYGADGVELSAHAISAPDHAPVQGRQFSNAEFTKMQSGLNCVDYEGREYEGFERPIGEWNCKHIAVPIILGVSKRIYDDETLEKYSENSDKKYPLTQKQRAYELRLRQLKRLRLAYSKVGDETMAKETQRKINITQQNYRTFSAKAGLVYHPERGRVTGYRRVSVKE